MIAVRFSSGSEYFKNRFVFGSSSVDVGFGYTRTLFTFGFVFGFCSVLGKTWVLVGFVLAGFGFFPRSLVSVERLRDRPYRSITTTIVFNWLLATKRVVVVVCSAGNCARARVWIERRVPPSPSVANHRVLRQTYASVACYRRIDVVDGSIQGLNCNPSTPPDGGSHHLYCLGKKRAKFGKL